MLKSGFVSILGRPNVGKFVRRLKLYIPMNEARLSFLIHPE